MGIVYYFDTYAFYEIIVNNPNYEKYSGNVTVLTTTLNLMELYYALLRAYGQAVADHYYNRLRKYCVPFTDSDIKYACKFRYKHKHRKMSYIDCLGYIIAVRRGAKFLTGDMAFKGFERVEFVI